MIASDTSFLLQFVLGSCSSPQVPSRLLCLLVKDNDIRLSSSLAATVRRYPEDVLPIDAAAATIMMAGRRIPAR